MRIGYAGRPASQPPQGGLWSPMDRMRRYSSACSANGMECLEIPANLLLGKGDWRNQLLTACTDAPRAHPDMPNVQLLVRLGDQHLANGENLAYARQLVNMYGGHMITVMHRPSRTLRLTDPADCSSEGGVAVGVIANWHHVGAPAQAMDEVRGSLYYKLIPAVMLGRERGHALGATVRRALNTCKDHNRSDWMLLYVAGKPSAQPLQSSNLDLLPILAAVIGFEQQSSAKVSVVFACTAAQTVAEQALKIRARLMGERLSSEAPRAISKIGSKVKIRDVELGTDLEYSIVPPEQASARAGRLSADSPVARAILGKPSGTRVEVIAPGGRILYELLEVNN